MTSFSFSLFMSPYQLFQPFKGVHFTLKSNFFTNYFFVNYFLGVLKMARVYTVNSKVQEILDEARDKVLKERYGSEESPLRTFLQSEYPTEVKQMMDLKIFLPLPAVDAFTPEVLYDLVFDIDDMGPVANFYYIDWDTDRKHLVFDTVDGYFPEKPDFVEALLEFAHKHQDLFLFGPDNEIRYELYHSH